MFLSLVDLEQRPVGAGRRQPHGAAHVHQPGSSSRLAVRDGSGDFELESGAPVPLHHGAEETHAGLRPPTGKSSLWRLISHLCHYLSLVAEGRELFRKILKLYNFTNSSIR